MKIPTQTKAKKSFITRLIIVAVLLLLNITLLLAAIGEASYLKYELLSYRHKRVLSNEESDYLPANMATRLYWNSNYETVFDHVWAYSDAEQAYLHAHTFKRLVEEGYLEYQVALDTCIERLQAYIATEPLALYKNATLSYLKQLTNN